MAESKNNVVTHGLSGKFGDQMVFRQSYGKTFVMRKAGPRTKPATEAQKANEKRFHEAVIYGKGAMADPARKAVYSADSKGKRAYHVAVADFFHAPAIEQLDFSGYSGLPGESIKIKAFDDFKVIEVKVAIYNADGTLVEEGAAVSAGVEGLWTYTATAHNESLAGDKIVVTASDYPANKASEEVLLEQR